MDSVLCPHVVAQCIFQDGRNPQAWMPPLSNWSRIFDVERRYLFLPHYFSAVLVWSPLDKVFECEVLRDMWFLVRQYVWLSRNKRTLAKSWPWRRVLFSSCISLAYVSCLPQADGTATLYKAVIDLKARPMHNRAALGNRPRDDREGLGVAMFQAPLEQLRGAS